MTQKKTMTKTEAREWLKDKCFLTTEENREVAILKMQEIGLLLWGAVTNEFPYMMMDGIDSDFLFLDGPLGNIATPLEDLLSIEIVEEPDHRALLEEAVKLLEECCPIMHRLTPDVKARSQINKIEQFLKANRP